MKSVLLFLLGMATANLLFLGGALILFKRGAWELEQYEREDGYGR